MSWFERWRTPTSDQDLWWVFHADCVDSDGRRREAALREFPQLPAALHGRALPLLLARLNDWVPQVRAAAAAALPLLLRDELEAAWMQALPEVVRLMGGSRWAQDGALAREHIEQFLLSSPKRRAALLACGSGLAPQVRRWLVRQSWQHGAADERLLVLTQALRGADARLAWQALRFLQAMSPDWQALAGVREALAAAHFLGLRLDVLRHEHSMGRFPTDDEALELAFIRHGGTRSWLLFHADPALKQRLQRRAEAVLNEQASADGQVVALQLLGEIGAESLPGHLAAAGKHPAARVREIAFVLSLRVHDATEGAALTGQALADPSPRVQRAARRALRLGRAALTLAELRALVRQQPRALRSVLCVLAHYEAWTRAPEVLRLLAEQPLHRELAAEELPALRRALQRSLYAPTPQQTSAVVAAAALMHQRHPELVFSLP